MAYCARVSNPDNQDNFDNTERLLNHCIKNRHWSVFEMSSAIVEVEAPRDISRQLLRHRSFSFQEFSQRYSDSISFTERSLRRQDVKNRQNSIDDLDPRYVLETMLDMGDFAGQAEDFYRNMLKKGVAKECARVVLPEGLTMSRLYVNGTLRSWIHYLSVRDDPGVTQEEHVILAREIREALRPAFPQIFAMLEREDV